MRSKSGGAICMHTTIRLYYDPVKPPTRASSLLARENLETPTIDSAPIDGYVNSMTHHHEDPGDAFFESLMKRYTEAWNREDIDAIESYYHSPFFSFKEGRLEVYADVKQGRDIDLEWIEVNRREGPATWVRLSSRFQRLGRNSVLVTTHWAFRRPEGSAVWDFVDSFQLCRFGEDWKFLSRTLHD